MDALIRSGRAADAFDAVTAFTLAHATPDSLAPTGLDGTDVALLGAKALSAQPAKAADGQRMLDDLVEQKPDDFRPALAQGLALRQAGRDLAADKALLRARLLAPKEARKMVDGLIGDR